MKNILQNVDSTTICVILIDKSLMLDKKPWILLKYLLNLKKIYAVTILIHGLTKSNRFFPCD